MTKNTTTSTPSLYRQGFTLIELLVVISIIVALAALGFTGLKLGWQKAKETSAVAVMGSLKQANDSFFDDYGYLPLSEGATADEERLSDSELLSVLVGMDSALDQNPKGETYFSYRKPSGKGSNLHNGLLRTSSQAILYGPWKNKNENDRLYRLKYNYDHSDEITEPTSIGGAPQYHTNVIIYHLGADGEAGPGKNQDNVYSYKHQ